MEFVGTVPLPSHGRGRCLGLLGFLRAFLGSRGVGMYRVPWGTKWGTRWGTLFGGSLFHRRGAVMLLERATVPPDTRKAQKAGSFTAPMPCTRSVWRGWRGLTWAGLASRGCSGTRPRYRRSPAQGWCPVAPVPRVVIVSVAVGSTHAAAVASRPAAWAHHSCSAHTPPVGSSALCRAEQDGGLQVNAGCGLRHGTPW